MPGNVWYATITEVARISVIRLWMPLLFARLLAILLADIFLQLVHLHAEPAIDVLAILVEMVADMLEAEVPDSQGWILLMQLLSRHKSGAEATPEMFVSFASYVPALQILL